MHAVNLGLAVAELAAAAVFAIAGSLLWKPAGPPASLAAWLVACAALGLGTDSLALCAGLPA